MGWIRSRRGESVSGLMSYETHARVAVLVGAVPSDAPGARVARTVPLLFLTETFFDVRALATERVVPSAAVE